MKTREQRLEEILKRLAPAVRDILWCAVVWNDHNFNHNELLRKSLAAANALGVYNVDDGNELLRDIDRALGVGPLP